MSVTDIAAIHGLALTPMFEGTLKCALAGAVLAVAEHPYCFNALRRVWSGPIVYSAHNVESLLKAAMLPKTKSGKLALDEVEAIERACCHHASRILVVSEQDAATMVDRYGVSRDKLAVVPNGTTFLESPSSTFYSGKRISNACHLAHPSPSIWGICTDQIWRVLSGCTRSPVKYRIGISCWSAACATHQASVAHQNLQTLIF